MDIFLHVHTLEGSMTPEDMDKLSRYIRTRITALGLTDLNSFGDVEVEVSCPCKTTEQNS